MTRDLMKRRRRFSPIDGVLALMTLVFDPGFNLTIRCFKRRAVRAGCGRLGSMATRPGSPPPIDCLRVEPGDEPVTSRSSRQSRLGEAAGTSFLERLDALLRNDRRKRQIADYGRFVRTSRTRCDGHSYSPGWVVITFCRDIEWSRLLR